MGNTCSFTGQRYMSLPFGSSKTRPGYICLKNVIRETLIYLYNEYGVRQFISGMALGSDQIFAEEVIMLKKSLPDVNFICMLPCSDQSDRWNRRDRNKYEELLSKSDEVITLEEKYSEGCMQKRNDEMIRRADIVLCVWGGRPGGTAKTVAFAESLNKPIIKIHPRNFSIERINL